jgi:hypothetical protein
VDSYSRESKCTQHTAELQWKWCQTELGSVQLNAGPPHSCIAAEDAARSAVLSPKFQTERTPCIFIAMVMSHLTVMTTSHSFQASAAMLTTSALFWDITRRRVVIVYRRFGKTYRSHLHGSRVRLGKEMPGLLTREDGTDTSWNVGKHHTALRNVPEERRYHVSFNSTLSHVLAIAVTFTRNGCHFYFQWMSHLPTMAVCNI